MANEPLVRVVDRPDPRRAIALASGLLIGVALVAITAGVSWETAAVGLGFALAALAGIAQRCSA
jgi:hypothetical protein